MNPQPQPIIRRRARYIVAGLALAAAAVMAWRHWQHLTDKGASNQELVFAVAFAWLLLLAVVPYFHTDLHPRTPDGARHVDRLRVHVAIPAHNEDPDMFLAMLNSLAAQTRLPQRIHVVENGYPERKLQGLFERWKRDTCPAGIEALYSHNLEPSKRSAQMIAWDADPTFDIAMTLDSDIQLDPGAIAEGVAPFAWRRIKSVCGLIVGLNHRKNLLTRLVEAPFVCSFLGGRAAFSMLRSVDVNGGALAFYRGDVIRRYRDHYLNHTIAGRKFGYGDDAMMTRYALLEGNTVFQAGSWGYTLHPEHLRHLTKQRLRWWRSYFWGNVWLLRTFRPTHVIWWLTAWKFTSFAWYSVLLPLALVVAPVRAERVPWGMLWWVLVIGVFSQARYLTIRRPDESFWSQLGTFALAPAGSVLAVYLSWVLQYVGLATCLKTGWSTRQTVEVGLTPGRSDDETVVIPRLAGADR